MRKCFIILCAILILCISSVSCSNDKKSDSGAIDVDFASLSATIAEALYYNVVNNAADYMGQRIRATGTYYPMTYPQNDYIYHYIIVVQGDECCQLYFEFRLPEDDIDYDDFPPAMTYIEVTGILSRYVEKGASYIYLADSEIVIKRSPKG